MAIYHLHAKVISRSSGRSATGAAAYRAGAEIVDERTGLVHDYQRKGGVDHTEIMAPTNAPAWVHDRGQLWNRVELAEKRRDSQVCREVEIALPNELNATQMQELVRSFAQSQFVDKGMVADVAIHHIDSGRNPHCHILLATRDISPQGFGQKNRDWNRKELLQQWREAWEQQANKALELAGHEQRIDHRTLEAQGIEAVPQVHLGPKVLGLECRGVHTDMGSKALAIKKTNAQIIDLQRYREAIEHERNRATGASQEHRRPSGPDRTVGAGPSGSVGRDAPNAGGPEDRDPGAGEGVGPAAASGRGSSGTVLTPSQTGSGYARGEGQGIEAGGAGVNVATVPDGVADRSARSGGYDRVVALAAPAHGGREAATGARGASGGQVARAEPSRAGRGGEGDGVAIDRTYLAVRRQLEAMKCEQYEIGVRDQQGRMLTRTWSTAEVLKSVPWLKRENAKGSDIYVRPAGEQNQGLVLADDLNQKSLEAMKQEGFAPAVVVETSQANYQAWVRISPTPLEPSLATAASKGIAKRYGADPNSADWRHFGRLSGFTNRKPEHVDEIGRNPWVLCHEASGSVAPRGAELTDKLKQVLREQEAIAERDSRLERAVNASGRVYGHDPSAEYQKQIKRLVDRYGANMDVSKADYMIARDMAMQGYSADQLTQTLQEHSPELPVRKAGHEGDYCRRTVEAVFKQPDVQSRLQELKREQEREQDHDGPSL